MPDAVYYAKDAQVLNVDDRALLGLFKTVEIRVRQKIVDQSAPVDGYEFHRAVRRGATLSYEAFIGQGTASLSGNLVDLADLDDFAVSTTFVDGRSFTGTFSLEDGAWSGSDDPNSESGTCRSHGEFAIS